MKGFSPVCLRMCLVRWALDCSNLLQTKHWNVLLRAEIICRDLSDSLVTCKLANTDDWTCPVFVTPEIIEVQNQSLSDFWYHITLYITQKEVSWVSYGLRILAASFTFPSLYEFKTETEKHRSLPSFHKLLLYFHNISFQCLLMWRSLFPFWENDCPQTLHTKHFSPVCTLIWRAKCELDWRNFPHTSQEYNLENSSGDELSCGVFISLFSIPPENSTQKLSY